MVLHRCCPDRVTPRPAWRSSAGGSERPRMAAGAGKEIQQHRGLCFYSHRSYCTRTQCPHGGLVMTGDVKMNKDVGDYDPSVKTIICDSQVRYSVTATRDQMTPISIQSRCVSTHRCLCPGPCDGCEGGRRQRSSSPAVCAWRRRLAWGRCSEAADGTRVEPSPSQPAHRLRPSWSACIPGP